MITSVADCLTTIISLTSTEPFIESINSEQAKIVHNNWYHHTVKSVTKSHDDTKASLSSGLIAQGYMAYFINTSITTSILHKIVSIALMLPTHVSHTVAVVHVEVDEAI